MPISLLMPALSPTMTEGKLANWIKNEGDTVAAGDVVAEIETDKATMEVEAVDEGVLGKILVPAGTEGVAVNSPIGIILEEGEDVSALEGFDPGGASAPAAEPASAGKQEPAPASQPAAAPAAKQQPSGAPTASDGRIFASPLARRMAANNGLDLGRITGSGPHGRIVKRDIEAALAAGTGKVAPAAEEAKAAPEKPAPAAAPQPVSVPEGTPYTEIPNSTMRKIVARRLSEAKREMPHFYLTIECNIDAVTEMRQQLNGRAPEGDGGYKLTVNDFIIRAVALALRAFPAANVTWTEQAILQYETVDVSVAVATPNGLITPIIRNADQKGLAAISNEVRLLAGRARDGKLMPEEYQGGGFTVSNLGMFGIKEFSAILNPPQSAILAVGAGEQRPIVKDGALAVATMMGCTLSVDHRSIDGAVGAQFLQIFKRLMEDPLTMML